METQNLIISAARLKALKKTGIEIRRINSLMRLFLNIDPNKLSDEEYAQIDSELKYSLKITGKITEKNGVITFINNG